MSTVLANDRPVTALPGRPIPYVVRAGDGAHERCSACIADALSPVESVSRSANV